VVVVINYSISIHVGLVCVNIWIYVVAGVVLGVVGEGIHIHVAYTNLIDCVFVVSLVVIGVRLVLVSTV
jgi:hypothetical protein